MRNLGLAVLLAVLVFAQAEHHLFLSPAYPPTAFYEQYYEARFRVRGLTHPTFRFENLPSFLEGSEDGVVSGTPDITGTFRITVHYSDDEHEGESRVVISVTSSPFTVESEKQSAAVVYLVIETALSTWVYRSGDNIAIDLVAKHGVAPLTWSFANLPDGLFSDNSGRVWGRITEAGLYSFRAAVGDAHGQKAESYYTLNIQPGTLIKSKSFFMQPTTLSRFLTATSLLSMTWLRCVTSRLLLTRQSLTPSLWLPRHVPSSRASKLPPPRPRPQSTSLLTKRKPLK